MADDKLIDTPKLVKSVWPAVVLFISAIVTLYFAQGYSEVSRRFPVMVSYALAVLACIDFYSRTRLPGVEFLNAFWGSGFGRREMTHNPKLRDELIVAAWVLVAFFGMAAVGIIIAAPLFCLLYVRLRSGRSWLASLAVAVVVLVFEAVIFEWVLDYELYRGLIFMEEGFSAW